MSTSRPSWRHGLPYRWWSAQEFWMGLMTFVTALAALVGLTLVLLAWWGLV